MSDTADLNLALELWPKQALLLDSKATEILFGGAASGGKSHLSRVLSILWAIEIPGIQIYFFRRLYDDLVKNHIEGPTGFRAMLAKWTNARHPKSPLPGGRLAEVVEGEIRFWNGSKIFLCHLQHQKDLSKYYGPEFHVLFIEEATQFTEFMIRFLRSRMRIPDTLKIPDKYKKPKEDWRDPERADYYFPRAIYTSNPGGVGHSYLKRSFLTGHKPFDYHRAPDTDAGHLRQFIPARVDDNPSVNREEVKANLAGLPPMLVDAMLNGNWDAVIGAFFPEIDPSVHLIEPFRIPDHWVRFQSMDWGACGDGDPFSIGWYAVSDGVNTPYPRGALIRYRSWYGAGLPKVTASQVAAGIRTREQGESIVNRYAGGDIEQKRGSGPSIYEVFADEGIFFSKADQRRQPGHLQFRERLVGKNDKPMLYFFNTQEVELETIMNLQHCPNDPNETTQFGDHVYEECLDGSTKITTDTGIDSIENLVGTIGKVQNHLGEWVEYKNCKSYGIQETIELQFSNGSKLQCTSDHLIMNKAGEWIEAIDMLDQYCYTIQSCKQRSLLQHVKNLTGESITSLLVASTIITAKSAAMIAYIGTYGRFIMGRFQKDFISITKTITLIITKLRIFLVCPHANMAAITGNNQTELIGQESILNQLENTPPFGTRAQRVESRHAITTTNLKCKKNYILRFCERATHAMWRMLQKVQGQCFALKSVKDVFGNLQERILLKAIASFAIRNIYIINIGRLKHVVGLVDKNKLPLHVIRIRHLGKTEVFCLDTPYPHSFLTSEGIVVHNCRYAVMSRPFHRTAPSAELPIEERYRPPTVNQLWDAREAQLRSRY